MRAAIRVSLAHGVRGDLTLLHRLRAIERHHRVGDHKVSLVRWVLARGRGREARAVDAVDARHRRLRLRVRAPTTGQDMTVVVPAGVEAGGLFDVPLPEPRLPSLGE